MATSVQYKINKDHLKPVFCELFVYSFILKSNIPNANYCEESTYGNNKLSIEQIDTITDTYISVNICLISNLQFKRSLLCDTNIAMANVVVH